jgi:Resolvase, N terminal domain
VNNQEKHDPGQLSPITAGKLKKLAILYTRSATHGAQVAQRALVERAQTFGWPAERIKIIEDFGYVGASSSRPGFAQMVALVDAGEVGAIVVSDLSRISRNPCELQQFLRKVQQAGVLVWAEGRIIDPTNWLCRSESLPSNPRRSIYQRVLHGLRRILPKRWRSSGQIAS